MSLYIIDYGMGNLLSVKRAFEVCGAKVTICNNPEELQGASHIVLPGVGSYYDGMKNIADSGWIEAIHLNVKAGTPLLGICLGMQLLASKGYEVKETVGLNLIEGEVIRLKHNQKCKIPHVGWNDIRIKGKSEILNKINDGTDFYFVHSYHFKPSSKESIVATTIHGEEFVSIIQKDNVLGAQFHPEKSGKAGFQLIKNFLSL